MCSRTTQSRRRQDRSALPHRRCGRGPRGAMLLAAWLVAPALSRSRPVAALRTSATDTAESAALLRGLRLGGPALALHLANSIARLEAPGQCAVQAANAETYRSRNRTLPSSPCDTRGISDQAACPRTAEHPVHAPAARRSAKRQCMRARAWLSRPGSESDRPQGPARATLQHSSTRPCARAISRSSGQCPAAGARVRLRFGKMCLAPSAAQRASSCIERTRALPDPLARADPEVLPHSLVPRHAVATLRGRSLVGPPAGRPADRNACPIDVRRHQRRCSSSHAVLPIAQALAATADPVLQGRLPGSASAHRGVGSHRCFAVVTLAVAHVISADPGRPRAV